jgi:hypothetical protein
MTIAMHIVNSNAQDMNLSLQGNEIVGFLNVLVATFTYERIHGSLVSDFFRNIRASTCQSKQAHAGRLTTEKPSQRCTAT